MKFKHPVTGKEMFIEAPLPEYFENVLKENKEGNIDGRRKYKIAEIFGK